MNSFKLALGNLKRNINNYILYLLAMIFSVVVYYNFVSLKYNPQLLSVQTTNMYVKPLAKAAVVLLLLFLVFFIWFSNSLFLKQRKKEIGIYAFMGVENSKIALMFAAEIFFTGLLATMVGLIFGILLGKLFMMLIAKFAILNVKIKFFISYKAIFESVITFLIIFILTSIKGYVEIVRSKLIELFNAAKCEEKVPRVNYVFAILSVVLIGFGYYFAIDANSGDFNRDVLLTILFLVLGTYLLFRSFYSMVLKVLIKNKRILYNGVNVISLSNISFRIKDNYKVLAAVAILITASITAFGTAYSIRYYVQDSQKLQKPYDFSYVTELSDKLTDKSVSNFIAENNNGVKLKESTRLLLVDKYFTKSRTVTSCGMIAVIKYSDFKRISKALKAKDLNTILKEADVGQNEIEYLGLVNNIISLGNTFGNSLKIEDVDYKVNGVLKSPLFGMGLSIPTAIMNDNSYEKLKGNFKEYKFTGVKLENGEKVSMLSQKLKSIDSIKKSLYVSYNDQKSKEVVPLTGLVYFFGAFLSMVFIIATGSIISFKLISESMIDKDKYVMLKKIGITKEEIRKSISSQIGISYILPLVVGIVHSCVAIKVLSRMLKYNIMQPALISIIIFGAIYGIFFIITTNSYISKIE